VSSFPGSSSESWAARQEAEFSPERRRGAPRPPGAPDPVLTGMARRIFNLAGIAVVIGVALAISIPLLGLRSTDCGSISCGLVQTVGKALAAGGIGVALGTVAIASLRAGRFSAATMAALVAGPALLWSVMVVDQWRQLSAGTDEATQVITVARDYAASHGVGPAADLRALIYNGRGDWLSVKLTAPNGNQSFVIARREGSTWTPVAAAPTFTRDELRALGAPTDLLSDPG
jgi:hypothetical protein